MQLFHLPHMATTSATCSTLVAITSATVAFKSATQIQQYKVSITSATILEGHNICLQNSMAIITAIVMWLPFTTLSIKIAEHTNTHTPKVLEIIKDNIFLIPQEAMLYTWQKLVFNRENILL